MDPDELRKAMIDENQAEDDTEVVRPEAVDDLTHAIRSEARKLAAQFRDTSDSAERRRLRERYEKLDGWLAEWQDLDALGEGTEKHLKRRELRATVLDEFRKWRQGGAEHRARERAIETGRKRLTEKAKAGVRDSAHKRIRDEIEYLLKNYTPSNEAKIETLIDKWRRSGDPSYDPSIKLRLRNARRKKDSQDYAL